jgi:hypothetical protein
MTESGKFKLRLAIAAAALTACGLTAAILIFHKEPPDPAQLSAESTAKFVASSEFAKMSPEQKAAWMKKARDANGGGDGRGVPREALASLSEDERKAARENMRPVFEQMMKDRMKQYFSLKTRGEKDKFLDEMIEQRQKMREARRAAGNNAGPGGGPPQEATAQNQPAGQQGQAGGQVGQGERRGPSAAEIRNRIESTDPETRAMMSQFRLDMRAREQSRAK